VAEAIKVRQFLAQFHDALGLGFNPAIELSKHLGKHPLAGSQLVASGHGPGSGPDANAHNVAMIVLAALAGGRQTEAGEAATALYDLPAETALAGEPDSGWTADRRRPGSLAGRPKLALRRAVDFGGAITAALADPAIAATVARVEVVRAPLGATIYLNNREHTVIRFGQADDVAEGLRVTAAIDGATLQRFAAALAA
jgi:hypothetical protein